LHGFSASFLLFTIGVTRKPPLEVAPTTLATFLPTVLTVRLILWVLLAVTYLQFLMQICFHPHSAEPADAKVMLPSIIVNFDP